MSDSVKESTWLLTEHLRYTPLSLIDDIINSVNALLYRAVSAVETGLLNAAPTSLGFQAPNSRSRKDRSKGASRKGKSQEATQGDERHDGRHDEVEAGEGRGTNEDENNDDQGSSDAKREIENGVHQLETLFEATVDKDFDKFEIYVLRNILTVPEEVLPWMRLGHYENLDLTPTSNAPSLESLNLQRRKVQEAQKLHRALLHETRRNAALIEQLRGLLAPSSTTTSSSAVMKNEEQTPAGDPDGQPSVDDDNNPTAPSSTDDSSPLAFLTSHPETRSLVLGAASGSSHQPLTTSSTFITSQLPALRALLATLRPKLARLAAAAAPPPHEPSSHVDDPTRSQSQEEELQLSTPDARTQYIETQTRRHLTTTQGLDLDATGAVRDGAEWQGPGRRIGPDEVRSLEQVVDILKAAKEEARRAGDGDGDGKGDEDGDGDIEMEEEAREDDGA